MNDKKPITSTEKTSDLDPQSGLSELLARIGGKNFADDPEGGQDQHVNFGFTKKPEQTLPQKRTASAADVQGRTVYDHSGREEETRGRSSIHQLHDDRGLERRKGEQQQKRSDKLCPNKKWQPH